MVVSIEYTTKKESSSVDDDEDDGFEAADLDSLTDDLDL